MKRNLHFSIIKSLFLVFLMFVSTVTFAQTFTGGVYNNGASIVIGTGAYLYIDGNSGGDYQSANGGYVDLDGVLSVEGDLFNNNANGDSLFRNRNNDGWIKFVGSALSLQFYGTSSDTIAFEKMEINRGAGSTITLNKSISVQGNVALTSGIITTKSGVDTNVFIMESTTASDLTGFSQNSFINGKFRRYIGSNTDSYNFPVGMGTATTSYRRVDFVNTAGLAGVSYLDVIPGVIDTSANSESAQGLGSALAILGTRIDSFALDANDDLVYWEIKPDQQPSAGTYGVNAYITNTNINQASYDGMFGLIKRPDASTGSSSWVTGGTPPSVATDPGRTVASGYAGSTGMTSFSKFAIGFSGFDVLPIELSSFDGICENGSISLNWTTASELTNHYFNIMRSEDGYNWENISTIYSQADGGNSNTPLNYDYEYLNLNHVKSAYYKLKQTDYNGKSTESDLIYIPACESEIQASVTAFAPNHDRIVVITKVPEYKEFQFDLLDASGRKVMYSRQLQGNEGVSQFEIKTFGLATGFYVVTLNSPGEIYTKKLFLK